MLRLLHRQLVLAVLLAVPLFAQTSSPIVQSGVASTTTCTFGKNVTSGNIVVAIQFWFNSTNTPSVSDSRSTSYAQAVLYNGGTSTTPDGAIYVGTLGSGGANTVTFTVSGASNQNTLCLELKSAMYGATVDITDNTNVSGSVSSTPNTISGTAVTTTVNGDLILGATGGIRNATVNGPGSGYTHLGMINNNDSGALEYKIGGVAGSHTVTFSNINNDKSLVLTVALKPATVGGLFTSNATWPDGALTKAYSFCPQVIGAVGAYTFSITSGALQTGLSLNTSTGCITGTPTSGPQNSITLHVVGATSGSADQNATLKIGNTLNTIALLQSNTTGVYGSNVTSGSLLTVGQRCTAVTCNVEKCTDTLSTPFVPVSIVNFNTVPGGTGASVEIGTLWAGIATSGGADTITCGGGTVLSAGEWSNAYLALDNVNLLSGTSASPVSSTALTTLVPNELIISLFTCFTNACTLSANSPFTTLGATTGGFQQYDLATTVTTYTSSTTMSGNTNGTWGVSLAGFRPTANGTAPADHCISCDMSGSLDLPARVIDGNLARFMPIVFGQLGAF